VERTVAETKVVEGMRNESDGDRQETRMPEDTIGAFGMGWPETGLEHMRPGIEGSGAGNGTAEKWHGLNSQAKGREAIGG